MANKHPVYLPFTSVGNSWQYTTIYDAKQDVVCRFNLEDWHVTEDNQGALEEDQAALVAIIVKAVNNHDALVAEVARLTELAKFQGQEIAITRERDEALTEAAQSLIEEIGTRGTHERWKRLARLVTDPVGNSQDGGQR